MQPICSFCMNELVYEYAPEIYAALLRRRHRLVAHHLRWRMIDPVLAAEILQFIPDDIGSLATVPPVWRYLMHEQLASVETPVRSLHEMIMFVHQAVTIDGARAWLRVIPALPPGSPAGRPWPPISTDSVWVPIGDIRCRFRVTRADTFASGFF